MTDTECPNCGGDNLDDYPVCATCALKCHFPARETCRHCAAAANMAEMLELLRYLSKSYDSDMSTGDLASTLYELRCMAIHLLNKIEGGGK